MQNLSASGAGHPFFPIGSAPAPSGVQISDPLPMGTKPRLTQSTDRVAKEIPSPFGLMESIPQDARLQVLNFVVRNRPPHTAHRDLVHYAQTSRTGTVDVARFYEIKNDPIYDLLASRTLVQKASAWLQPSLTVSTSSSRLVALADLFAPYCAAMLDLRQREGGQIGGKGSNLTQQIGPEIIAAAFRSDRPAYLHIKLGHAEQSSPSEGIDDREQQHAGIKKCLAALVAGYGARLQRGVTPPTLFLQADALSPVLLHEALKKGEFRLQFSGLSLSGMPENLFGEVMPQGSAVLNESRKQYDFSAQQWAMTFETMPDLRYLHLERWPGTALVGGLKNWLKKNQTIEELHLPNCDLNSEAISILFTALYKHKSLQCLALDGRQPMRLLDEVLLVSLLKGTPSLKLILGRPVESDSLLGRYRQEGRVLCDPYPRVAREMPEAAGVAHFLSLQTNAEAGLSADHNAV